MDIRAAQKEAQKSIEVFCCYARKDQSLLDELKKHLMPLKREGLITLWADTNINAGAEWKKEIHRHLDTAQIILLLVSPDFIASEYCYSVEMQRSIKRHEDGEARVIPIILRPVAWQKTPLGKLQALPTDASPITSRKWHHQDEAFYNVAEGIRDAVEAYLAEEERVRKAAEAEQARLAEEERLRKVEEEQIRKAEEEEARLAEEERAKKAEEEARLAEKERVKKAWEERARLAEEEEKVKKAEEEQARLAEEERIRKAEEAHLAEETEQQSEKEEERERKAAETRVRGDEDQQLVPLPVEKGKTNAPKISNRPTDIIESEIPEQNTPIPEYGSIDRHRGDIANVPFFPNPHAEEEKEHRHEVASTRHRQFIFDELGITPFAVWGQAFFLLAGLGSLIELLIHPTQSLHWAVGTVALVTPLASILAVGIIALATPLIYILGYRKAMNFLTMAILALASAAAVFGLTAYCSKLDFDHQMTSQLWFNLTRIMWLVRQVNFGLIIGGIGGVIFGAVFVAPTISSQPTLSPTSVITIVTIFVAILSLLVWFILAILSLIFQWGFGFGYGWDISLISVVVSCIATGGLIFSFSVWRKASKVTIR